MIIIVFKNINRFSDDKQGMNYDVLQLQIGEHGHSSCNVQSLIKTNQQWKALPTEKRLKNLAQLKDDNTNVLRYGARKIWPDANRKWGQMSWAGGHGLPSEVI